MYGRTINSNIGRINPHITFLKFFIMITFFTLHLSFQFILWYCISIFIKLQFLPLYCNKIQMTEKLALYNQKNFL